MNVDRDSVVTVETPFTIRLTIARQMITRGVGCLSQQEYDQVEAAVRDSRRIASDAARLVRLLQSDRGWCERTQSAMETEQRVYVLAALLDCVRATCIHLRREGPQPAFVQLPLRRVVCRRCVAILRKPPAEDADRCDVCGERGVERFVAFLLNNGPLVMGGDVCPSCAQVLGCDDAENVA